MDGAQGSHAGPMDNLRDVDTDAGSVVLTSCEHAQYGIVMTEQVCIFFVQKRVHLHIPIMICT